MKLLRYADVLKATETKTSHLLLGNGFSISYDPIFSYSSIYEVAVQNGLSEKARGVFEYLGTNNFEGVLKLLENVSWVSKLYYNLRDGGKMIEDDIRVIKETLIKSIANSHLKNAGEVPDHAKESALSFLSPYKTVFTTNYDLLLYWVNMHGTGHPPYGDCFRAEIENPDAEYVVFSERLGGAKGILFLHGALHLYFSQGEIKKHCWSRSQRPLIDLIREGLEAKKYPLFVAEGSPEKKLEQINSNAYLAYCLGKLGRIENRLIIFGNALGTSDRHIAETIADNTKIFEVYVGLYGDPSSGANQETISAVEMIQARRKKINLNKSKRERESPIEIKFYDSSTVNIWGK